MLLVEDYEEELEIAQYSLVMRADYNGTVARQNYPWQARGGCLNV